MEIGRKIAFLSIILIYVYRYLPPSPFSFMWSCGPRSTCLSLPKPTEKWAERIKFRPKHSAIASRVSLIEHAPNFYWREQEAFNVSVLWRYYRCYQSHPPTLDLKLLKINTQSCLLVVAVVKPYEKLKPLSKTHQDEIEGKIAFLFTVFFGFWLGFVVLLFSFFTKTSMCRGNNVDESFVSHKVLASINGKNFKSLW